MSDIKLIKNGLVLLPYGLDEADLEIENGTISRIEQDIPIPKGVAVIDADGKYVLPGFIDIHTNGINGFDLTNGVYDLQTESFDASREIYLEGLDRALRKYAETGTTRVVLASLASPLEKLKLAFEYVREYMSRPKDGAWNDLLHGILVEGTFMKLPEFSGAHNTEYFNEPSIKLFDKLQEASGGLIKIVNIVPEWRDAAIELIKYVSEKGIVSAAGHTGATGDEYNLALKNGTKLAIHFLNGPTGSSFKPFDGGGAVESVLRAEGIFLEIIADGYHVDKAYVLDVIKRKGFDKVVIITDSMFATSFDGPSRFNMLGVEGKVSENGGYLQIADRSNALFGSLLTMDVAFANVLNWLMTPVEGVWSRVHHPLSFEDALSHVSAMCSANPAKVLGLYSPDPGKKNAIRDGFTGSIEVGKIADVILADIPNIDGKYSLEIEQVLVKGRSGKEEP